KGKMEDQTVHFRHISLFYFRKVKNGRQACAKLRKVYGDNALQERQCQRWLKKFRAGVFDLDTPRSGRPTECDILIKREKNDPFLKRLITGDEKWIVYNKISTCFALFKTPCVV
ncbi:hypothetical protein WH47_07726, partial [Habropoda laboriosa]